MKKYLLVFLLSYSLSSIAAPIRGPVDLQVHLTTHMYYAFLVGKSSPLDSVPSTPMSHKHTFTQAAYQEQLWNSSTKLFVITALDDYFRNNRYHLISAIRKQFSFIKKIARRYPHRFAIAKNPEEAREIIHSGRKAFVLAIEGGDGLIQSQEDANYWADQGVSMIGIIHLKSNEYGSASVMKGFSGLLNMKGIFIKWFRCHKGLTPLGKKTVTWLAQAGILTDMSHMHPNTIRDTLDIIEDLGVPVVSTHGHLAGVSGDKNDLNDQVVRRIYRSGGMVGLSSGNPGQLRRSYRGYVPANYCEGSYQHLGILAHYMQRILGDRKDFAFGFATDMNGMVSHYRPMYGPKGCFYQQAKVGDKHRYHRETFDEFDIHGLNHIGSVRFLWDKLARDGFDVEPFMRSSERFLQIWQRMLNYREKHN